MTTEKAAQADSVRVLFKFILQQSVAAKGRTAKYTAVLPPDLGSVGESADNRAGWLVYCA